MTAGYIAGVYGQGPIWGKPWGGWLTSNGITRTVARMETTHVLDGDCFNFDQTLAIIAKIKPYQAQSLPTILLCYSLGVSTGTRFQIMHHIDLLVCIAGSSLGINYPINEANCGRSVLICGSGPLSNWGRNAGFSRISEISHVPHLLLDFHPAATAIVEQEVSHLLNQWVYK